MIRPDGRRTCDACGVLADTTLTLTATRIRTNCDDTFKVDICVPCFPGRVPYAVNIASDRREPTYTRARVAK